MTTYTSSYGSLGGSAGTRMTAFPNSAEMIETAAPHITQRRASYGATSYQDAVYTQNMTTPSNLLGSVRFVNSRVGDPTSYGLANDFFSFDCHPREVKRPTSSRTGSLTSSRAAIRAFMGLTDAMPLTSQTAKSLSEAEFRRPKPIFTVYNKGTSRMFGPGNEALFARDRLFTGIVEYPDRPAPKWSFRASDHMSEDKTIPPFIGDVEPGRYAYAGRLSSSDIIKPSTYRSYGSASEAVYVPSVARYSSVLPTSVTRTTSPGLRFTTQPFTSHIAPIAAAVDNLGASFAKRSPGSFANSSRRSLSVNTAPGTMRASRSYGFDSLANMSIY